MKTIISITILMLISTVLCGQSLAIADETNISVTTLGAHYPDYEKVEYECAFCGKGLFKYEEVIPCFGDNHFLSYNYWKADDRGKTFEFSKKIHLCDECYEQYADSLKKSMEETWNNFINNAKEEQSSKRIIEKEKQRQEKLNEIKSNIRALKEKKKLLERR